MVSKTVVSHIPSFQAMCGHHWPSALGCQKRLDWQTTGLKASVNPVNGTNSMGRCCFLLEIIIIRPEKMSQKELIMQRSKIVHLLSSTTPLDRVLIHGWIRTKRDAKDFFIY
jgi:hypothetical protein